MGELPSFIGSYRVVRQLGEGGMGAVFEAVHQAIERRVAIKVLHPEFARNAEFTARFFNEARAVNRVSHPGLVQISDYGQQPDGTTYIVMEFLDGESLARRLERLGGRLANPQVIHLGWQLADSLAAAHAKSIVHRDLKPDNVMIVPDPQTPSGERTKLLDFGIAKVAEQGPASRPRTRADQVMGTPMYMSPEQCAGAGGVDEKSDVYALGVMLFEMLAGRPPFTDEGDGKVMGMHMFVAPPPLRELAPDALPPLVELIERLLAKNKEARPTMRQVAAILERLGDQHPLPKRAGSNQAILAEDIELPDETIRVGQKRPKPSTLGQSAAQTLRRGPRLQRLGMAFGAGLFATGIIVLLAVRLTHRTDVRQTMSPPLPAAQEKRITLRIDSEPAGAQVLRLPDGQMLGKTPWQVTQQASAGRLRFRLHLDGHAEQELSLAASEDDHASAHLTPNHPPPAKNLHRTPEKQRIHPPLRPATPTDSLKQLQTPRKPPNYVKPPIEK